MTDQIDERAAWLATLDRQSVTAEFSAMAARTADGRRAHEAEGRAARALHALIEGLRPGAADTLGVMSVQAVLAGVAALRLQLAVRSADESTPVGALRLCDDATARLQRWASAASASGGLTTSDRGWPERTPERHDEHRSQSRGRAGSVPLK